ncbi:unnamed protein product [Amoebophrya sp. A120]|nr:unnamed protein product [Amoebophrya sp. A120]|eukprot:GSA120T00020849001.1
MSHLPDAGLNVSRSRGRWRVYISDSGAMASVSSPAQGHGRAAREKAGAALAAALSAENRARPSWRRSRGSTRAKRTGPAPVFPARIWPACPAALRMARGRAPRSTVCPGARAHQEVPQRASACRNSRADGLVGGAA